MELILGFGHSHSVAIANGFDRWKSQAPQAEQLVAQFHYLHAPEFAPNFADSEKRLNPAILEKFAQPNLRAAFLSLGGNEHNVLSALQIFGPVDFILAENQDLPLESDAEILTEAAVRETLRGRAQEQLALIGAFRAATSKPMIFFESPPPLPRRHILDHPGELLGAPIAHAAISPEVFRYKMWRLSCALYREACETAGIVYIPVPSSLIDSQGMLAVQGLGQDATHANDLFGFVMVKEAINRLGVQ
jgi:hypothetical protein